MTEEEKEKRFKKLKEQFADDLAELGIEVRICSDCGKLMGVGYIISDGDAYYCSDNRLESNMTKEEYNELHADGEGDSYWTEWNSSYDSTGLL